jgi:hypothetical protein
MSTEARRASWNRYNAKRYAADPAAEIERVRAWQKANPDKANDKSRIWRIKNPEKLRWYNVKRTYGISKQHWEAMFAVQGYACAICETDDPGAEHGWHTDHIHGTKIVRGILCHHCNTMLGRAKDNPEILIKGAEYLRRSRP